MAEATTAGGFYIGRDGRAHDAEGEDLGLPLPESFPVRSVFVDQEGLLTVEQVCEVEDLTEIKGVAEATQESVCDELEAMAVDVGPATGRAISDALDRWSDAGEDEPEADDDAEGEDADDGGEDGES